MKLKIFTFNELFLNEDNIDIILVNNWNEILLNLFYKRKNYYLSYVLHVDDKLICKKLGYPVEKVISKSEIKNIDDSYIFEDDLNIIEIVTSKENFRKKENNIKRFYIEDINKIESIYLDPHSSYIYAFFVKEKDKYIMYNRFDVKEFKYVDKPMIIRSKKQFKNCLDVI